MNSKSSQSFLRTASAGGIFLLSFTLLTAFAQAQTKPGLVEQGAAVQRAATELQLSSEQEAAFVLIVGDFRDAVEATMEKYNYDPEEGRPPLRFSMAIRSDMKRNVAQMEQQLSAVLTPQQMQKFKAMRQQLRGARRGS